MSTYRHLLATAAFLTLALLAGLAPAVQPVAAGRNASLDLHNGQSAEAAPTSGVASIRITRAAGLLLLPAVDRTISDPEVAGRLASDVLLLPPLPTGTIHCPVDFGTTYTMTFRTARNEAWTAVVAAQGCQGVSPSDGRKLWALTSPSLFTDLGTALGLGPDEVIPRPCPALPGVRCYAQPSSA